MGRGESFSKPFSSENILKEETDVLYISGCLLRYVVLYFVSLRAVVSPSIFNSTLGVEEYWREYLGSWHLKQGHPVSDICFWSWTT